jgi:hypothetical protein
MPIPRGCRRAALAAVASAGLVAGCGGLALPQAGAASPVLAGRAYFAALMHHQPARAKALVCASGWRGKKSFSFTTFSFTRHPSPRATLSTVHPSVRQVSGAWLVALDHVHDLPTFRVVRAPGGGYLVCGVVQRKR